MTIVSCYSMDLYCDNTHCQNKWNYFSNPACFIGSTFEDCAQKARNIGWIIKRKENICICPNHSGKKKKIIVKEVDSKSAFKIIIG